MYFKATCFFMIMFLIKCIMGSNILLENTYPKIINDKSARQFIDVARNQMKEYEKKQRFLKDSISESLSKDKHGKFSINTDFIIQLKDLIKIKSEAIKYKDNTCNLSEKNTKALKNIYMTSSKRLNSIKKIIINIKTNTKMIMNKDLWKIIQTNLSLLES